MKALAICNSKLRFRSKLAGWLAQERGNIYFVVSDEVEETDYKKGVRGLECHHSLLAKSMPKL